jgi:predicted nucleic acid-binding protein
LRDIEIINITPDVIAKTEALLEVNVLRAMDALHLACASEWQAELFVTSDRRQEKAAKTSQLNTIFIE